MVSQQTCPSCATANSTFASACRNCATPLTPRSQLGNGSEGFAVYRSGLQPPEPPLAVVPPSDTYVAAPRPIAGEESGWPADRLSPSRFEPSPPAGWTGLPPASAAAPERAAAPWGPPSAPPPQRSDGHQPAGMVLAGAPPVSAPTPRAALAFHLDVGAGAALVAAPSLPGPPPSPPPPLPAGGAAPSSAGAPGVTPDQSGGRGWGIRQRRHPSPVATIPAEASADTASRFAVARRRPVPAAVALPPAPWEEAASPRRRHAGLHLFVVLLLAALVAVGVLLYLSGGFNQGLGSGTHTLSAPATLDGLAQDSSAPLQSTGQALQGEIEGADSSAHVLRQLLTAFYGSAPSDGTATTPEYFLFLSAFQSPLTTADLNQFETLVSAGTVESEDGVGFHCGAPTGGPMSSLCFWIDGNVLGVVEGTAGVGPAATLAAAEEARASAEH